MSMAKCPRCNEVLIDNANYITNSKDGIIHAKCLKESEITARVFIEKEGIK